MAKKVYDEEKIRAVADKIRELTEEETKYTTAEMPGGIDEVYSKGYNSGFSDGVATQPAPSIYVSSDGLITATAGNKSATKQLPTQGANTITPSTSTKTAVASGRYTTGEVTVKGDSNLVAANIKKGVTIFGVAGTLDGGGYDDGYSDGQALFLQDFADWQITHSGEEYICLIHNYHDSLTLSLDFIIYLDGALNDTWHYEIPPDDSVSQTKLLTEASNYHFKIQNVKFVK